MSTVPAPIIKALALPPEASVSGSGLGSGFTSTGKIHAQVPTPSGPQEYQYFVKTSSNGTAAEEMFTGESESLNAIAASVPGFCPKALAHGALDRKTHFLATEYLDLGIRGKSTGNETLAQRLGKLHTTPAPVDPETGRARYGFPVPTFCGDTKQPNRFCDSWADFYANERLLTVLATSEERNGPDKELRRAVERTAGVVVPRLLGDEHLGYTDGGGGIQPVVIHGDLWSGNADRGRIVGGEAGDMVYDPSACYGHSEFELGIMNMFGGFGAKFFEEYHAIVPKTEPVAEYGDRVELYELYHHLNHHAIFGAYRSGAMSIMDKLIGKYASD